MKRSRPTGPPLTTLARLVDAASPHSDFAWKHAAHPLDSTRTQDQRVGTSRRPNLATDLAVTAINPQRPRGLPHPLATRRPRHRVAATPGPPERRRLPPIESGRLRPLPEAPFVALAGNACAHHSRGLLGGAFVSFLGTFVRQRAHGWMDPAIGVRGSRTRGLSVG